MNKVDNSLKMSNRHALMPSLNHPSLYNLCQYFHQQMRRKEKIKAKHTIYGTTYLIIMPKLIKITTIGFVTKCIVDQ